MIKCLLLFLLLSQVTFGQSKTKSIPILIDTSVNLYAFVGEKISVIEYDPNADYDRPLSIEVDSTSGDTLIRRRSYIMDNAFDAKFKILIPVFNDLKIDTIIFKAFDHYGRPAFEKLSPVLLYVSRSENGNYYFHQKYQYDQLKRKKNTWVGKNGESLVDLFNQKKKTVFTARGLFKE